MVPNFGGTTIAMCNVEDCRIVYKVLCLMSDVACCVHSVCKRTYDFGYGYDAWRKLLGRGVGEKLGLNVPPPPL